MGGGAESHYGCSSIEEMAKIINNIDVSEDAVCLMWCTYPQLPEGLRLMKLWGFEYKTVAFTWIKTYNKQSNKFFFGMGRYTRANPEICLLGTKGKGIKRINNKITNVQVHKIREHSRKPDAIREEIIKLFGNLPKIEIFAREQIEGWDAYGFEKGNEIQNKL